MEQKRERRSRDKRIRSRPDWCLLQLHFDPAGIHEFSAQFIRRQAFEVASELMNSSLLGSNS
jgi:hypothetical protein